MDKRATTPDNKVQASPTPGSPAKKQLPSLDGSVFVGPPQPPRIIVKTTTTTSNVVGSAYVGVQVSTTPSTSTPPEPVPPPKPPAKVSAPAPPAKVTPPSPPAFAEGSVFGSPMGAKSIGSGPTIGAESTTGYSILQGPSFAIGGSQVKTAIGGTGSPTASTPIGTGSKTSATKSVEQQQTAAGGAPSAATKSVGGSPKSSKIVPTDVDPKIVTKIEEGYAILQSSADCKSLLKKYLTKDVMDKLKTKKTSFESTLWDVIQSGVKNLDSGVGVYAPDAEAYRTFADLFDPILADYHGFKSDQKQPTVDLGEGKIEEFADLDPENKFIVSTRIRCGRSIQGYPFNPCLTEVNYKEMEQRMITLFGGLKDPDLQGTYYPLTGMTKEVQNELIKDHFLFKEGDRFLREANACRFWPTGRGIFLNQKKTFLVWVNEEDHLRIISMQPGGHVGQVLQRLIKGLKVIEAQMPFSRDDRYGWLTFCPTNLGTTVRASVHIKLPKISKSPDFKTTCDSMKLQIRGIHGEHSETEGGVYDISNKIRLGFSEYAVVKQMYDGVKKLIEMEKAAP